MCIPFDGHIYYHHYYQHYISSIQRQGVTTVPTVTVQKMQKTKNRRRDLPDEARLPSHSRHGHQPHVHPVWERSHTSGQDHLCNNYIIIPFPDEMCERRNNRQKEHQFKVMYLFKDSKVLFPYFPTYLPTYVQHKHLRIP